MKKIILSLIAICSMYVATAQSCVSVQQVSTNYATNQITFDVKWGTCNNTNHLYRVWVFVDYRPVTITTKGAWSRATIAATDKGTLVSANNGVWVTGSANTTQRVTLTLDVIGDKFDWCAFAIDYPPNATMSNGVYTLKGTPPFIINNNTTWSANTYTGNITAITDATGNPEGFVESPSPGSTNWTNCSGFSYISNVSYENNTTMTWSLANTYCANKGMRLPTRTELECMCSNKASLPGGYGANYYWSSTAYSSGRHYFVFLPNCLVHYISDGANYYVKCVK